MVVLFDHSRRKKGGDFVADEFFDHAAMLVDDIGRNLVKAVNQLAELIGVHRLRELG